jgi:hypothetical protein
MSKPDCIGHIYTCCSSSASEQVRRMANERWDHEMMANIATVQIFQCFTILGAQSLRFLEIPQYYSQYQAPELFFLPTQPRTEYLMLMLLLELFHQKYYINRQIYCSN